MLEASDRWHSGTQDSRPEAQLIDRARLLASDTLVANPGGGNFSVKAPTSRPGSPSGEVMWISGWGCDGATLRQEDLACLRVADVRAARDQPALATGSMMNYLVGCATSDGQPRPAIETLLHGYLVHAHVDHTHPEAVIALTATPRGRELAAEVFGDEAIWLDYVQFSPALAVDLAAEIAARPAARYVLLANHGLLTWADSSEQAYQNTIEATIRAGRALDAAAVRPADLGGLACPLPSPDLVENYFTDVLPALRGWLSADGRAKILRIDPDSSATAFACSARGPWLSMLGPACPDSLVKMKRTPVIAPGVPADGPDGRRAAVASAVESFRDDYRRYWRRHAPSGSRLPVGADLPRVVVIRGIGVVSAGEDERIAWLAEAHFRQTRHVVEAADAAGGYGSLSERQAFADEYWPLMREKPQLRETPGRLAGRIVLVRPGAGELASLVPELARILLSEGAHVVVAGPLDAPAPGLRLRYDALHAPVRACVLAFGGLDIVVDLDPVHHPAARLAAQAADVLRQQGWPGCYLAISGGSAARPGMAEVLGAVRRAARGWLAAHSVTTPGSAEAVAHYVAALSSPAGQERYA